jgi:hypothetical protein
MRLRSIDEVDYLKFWILRWRNLMAPILEIRQLESQYIESPRFVPLPATFKRLPPQVPSHRTLKNRFTSDEYVVVFVCASHTGSRVRS